MHQINFLDIVAAAWAAYDPSRPIQRLEDISAKVSTNHVYKISLAEEQFIIGKL